MENIDYFSDYLKVYFDYSNIKLKNISSFKIIDNTLIFSLDNVDFSSYNKVEIVFKNIKTREFFTCDFEIHENIVSVDLDYFKIICSDYEFNFFILCRFYERLNVFCPVFSNFNSYSNNHNSSEYKWYTRILDNGDFRISSIALFSNTNKDKQSFSI